MGRICQHQNPAVIQSAATYDWRSIWLVSAGTSAIVLIFFLLPFEDKVKNAETALSIDERATASAALESNALPQ